jgi:signal transduction histidine kinase
VNTAFGRRLQLVASLEIMAVLWILVFGLALFAFGSFVQSTKADLAGQLQQVVVALDASPNAATAQSAANAVAAGYVRSGVVVIVFDRTQRIDLYRADRSDPQVAMHPSKRGQPLAGAIPNAGLSANIILGLATAFGLQALHAHVGGVDLTVREADVSLVNAVEPFILPFFVALVLTAIFAFMLARALTRQVLRPLVEVQAALERFASGDLRPQPIAADARSSLGGLAVAYNGAIEQMQRAFAEDERANASMRQFIADASHQLRTPLTVVRGFIAILRKGDLRSPEDRARILETMHRQSALMGSLIDKLMLLDRWEESDERRPAEPIDISRLVEDVVAPLAEAHPDRAVRVETRCGELAAIDPIDLSHAVTNIVDNALKYTAGAVDVAVSGDRGRVVVTISDAGPGMTGEEIDHAFDRFFRGARRDVEGTGLGLAIARRAIERAGGSLTLESDVRHGSRFTISLPAAARAALPEPVPSAV